jgi:hypothetical protein
MVTVCGGAAPRGAPVRLWILLATQCPRLRRLSGGAAAPFLPLAIVGSPRSRDFFRSAWYRCAIPVTAANHGAMSRPEIGSQTETMDAKALRMRSSTTAGSWKSSRQVKWTTL